MKMLSAAVVRSRITWMVLCAGLLCGLIPRSSASNYRLSGRKAGCHWADIVFVLDGSSSIWQPDFLKQLAFVEHVVDQFDVGPEKTRIGVMTFGNDVKTIFNLGDFNSKSEIKAAIDGIEQVTGDTYTDKALKRLRTDMFSSLYARPGLPMIGIVITDGMSTDPEETVLEAKLTHNADIQMFAVGVGAAVDKEELHIIASNDKHVYMVESYGELEELKKYIVTEACHATVPPHVTTAAPEPQNIQGCTGALPMDQIWAISDLAGVTETNQAIDLIKDVINYMTIGPQNVMVGLTPRLCPPGNAIRLKDHDTERGLLGALDGRSLNGELQTDRHIEYIRKKGMLPESGAREGTTKFGILIIDGPHGDNLEATITEAAEAKDEGIDLIVIGVGKDVQMGELRKIASSDRNILTVDNYDEILNLRKNITDIMCQGLFVTRWSHHRSPVRRYYDLEQQLRAVDSLEK